LESCSANCPQGGWVEAEVPFVSPGQALKSFTEPEFKIPLDDVEREAFLSTIGRYPYITDVYSYEGSGRQASLTDQTK
jgi:hypothetical protein